MVARKHAIVTACDAKCGDFLKDHWLPSLRDNVQLEQIDVIVFDYGLSEQQRNSIDRQGAIRRVLVRDGFVNNLRWRDVAALATEVPYDQILLIDSGDLIFQADISHLFEQHKDSFRATCEQHYTAQYEYFISTSDFVAENYKQMVKTLEGKGIINTGVIFGPANRFRQLWPAMQEMVASMQNWGTMQLVLNYLFYRDGFVELPYPYNFVLMTAKAKWKITKGRFYDQEGNLIPVVHNAGGRNVLRLVTHFGYGLGRNRRKWFLPLAMNAFFTGIRWWKAGTSRKANKTNEPR